MSPPSVPGTTQGPARIGLFTTFTGTSSRALITRIIGEAESGALGPVRVAFVFVNREAGESEETDASVARVEGEGVPVVRASAVRFEPDARRFARDAAAKGDDGAMWAWRDRFYRSYADRLPSTDLDVLAGDMWIWGRSQCEHRRGVNLHPSLPSGPLGKMWYDVVWDLIAAGAEASGVMTHRVTPEVDRGPVVTWCRYPLRTPQLERLWNELPDDPAERSALIERERALRRDTDHPLFHAIRAEGFRRETPLILETIRAVAEGRLRLRDGAVLDGTGRRLRRGLDLTRRVEGELSESRVRD